MVLVVEDLTPAHDGADGGLEGSLRSRDVAQEIRAKSGSRSARAGGNGRRMANRSRSGLGGSLWGRGGLAMAGGTGGAPGRRRWLGRLAQVATTETGSRASMPLAPKSAQQQLPTPTGAGRAGLELARRASKGRRAAGGALPRARAGGGTRAARGAESLSGKSWATSTLAQPRRGTRPRQSRLFRARQQRLGSWARAPRATTTRTACSWLPCSAAGPGSGGSGSLGSRARLPSS